MGGASRRLTRIFTLKISRRAWPEGVKVEIRPSSAKFEVRRFAPGLGRKAQSREMAGNLRWGLSLPASPDPLQSSPLRRSQRCWGGDPTEAAALPRRRPDRMAAARPLGPRRIRTKMLQQMRGVAGQGGARAGGGVPGAGRRKIVFREFLFLKKKNEKKK